MKFLNQPACHKKRQAFTLTEIAIVLGVFGVITAAMWGFASSARQSMRVRQTFEGITSIVDNVRSIYAAQTSINGTYATLVPTLIQQGVIPRNLLSGHTTTCPGGSTTNYAITPWGTYDNCSTLRVFMEQQRYFLWFVCGGCFTIFCYRNYKSGYIQLCSACVRNDCLSNRRPSRGFYQQFYYCFLCFPGYGRNRNNEVLEQLTP